jgi:N-acetylneuraminic acid mutarotase
MNARLTDLTLAIGLLLVPSCRDNTEPSQPATQSPPAPSFAVASNSWTTKARMPTARSSLVAGVVNNSSSQPILYAIGGESSTESLDRVEGYNFASNTWTRRAALPLPIRHQNGAGVIGGKVYVSGGELSAAGQETTQILPYLYVYNPSTNAWTQKASMPRPISKGITGVINGKLYVLTGLCDENCTDRITRRLYRYDPVTNKWDATLPWCPESHLGGAGGVINGKFYVAGGQLQNGSLSRRLHMYDPATNKWTIKASMSTVRFGAAGAVVGNRLYVLGGIKGLDMGPLATVEAYDPATNTWKTRASMPTARTNLAAASVTWSGQSYILAVGGSLKPTNESYKP